MIDSLRKWGGSWSAKVLLGVLAASMGLFWGIGDIFTQLSGGDTVASVGDAKISARELARELESRLALIEQRLGRRLMPEQIREARLPVSMLMEMIQETLLDEEGKRLRLVVTDKAVKEAVLKMPQFHDQTQKFSRPLFEKFLKNKGLHEKRFLDRLKNQMRRAQLTGALSNTIQLPKVMGDLLLSAQFQKRYAKVCVFESGRIQAPSPSQETLKEFYEKEKNRFPLPEKRQFTFAILDPIKFLQDRRVPEEELREAFDKRAAEFAKGEQSFEDVRELLQGELLKQKAAERLYEVSQQIEDDLAAGLSLTEVGDKYQLTLVRVPPVSRRLPPEEDKARLVLPQDASLRQEILNDVFERQAGTDPVLRRVQNGASYLLCLEKIFPSHVPPFEAIVAQVKEVWLQEKRMEGALELAKGRLASLKARQGAMADFVALPPVSLSDKQENEAVPPQVKTILFEMAPGDFRIAQDLKGRIFLVQLVRIEEPKGQELKENMPAFLDRLKQMLEEDVMEAYVRSLKPRFHVKINRDVLQRFFS